MSATLGSADGASATVSGSGPGRPARSTFLFVGLRERKVAAEEAREVKLRAVLLQRLDIDGPINELPAWRRLVDDIQTAVSDLERASTEQT